MPSRSGKPSRPPKHWFRRCVKSVKSTRSKSKNPEALCAWNWYHQVSPTRRKEIYAEEKKMKSRKSSKKSKSNKAMEIGGKSLTKFQSDVAYYLTRRHKLSASQAFKLADSRIVINGFTSGYSSEFVASTLAHKKSSARSANAAKSKESWENECLRKMRGSGAAKTEREAFFLCLAAKNKGMTIGEMIREAAMEAPLPSTRRHKPGSYMPSTRRDRPSGRILANANNCENCGKYANKLHFVKDKCGEVMCVGKDCAKKKKFKKAGLLDRIAYKFSKKKKPVTSVKVCKKFYLDSINKKSCIVGGLSSGMSIKDIAKMHKVSLRNLTNQLKAGTKVELEHTSSKIIAKRIAMDHLYEDPIYYKRLAVMERKSKKDSAHYRSEPEMKKFRIYQTDVVNSLINRNKIPKSTALKMAEEQSQFVREAMYEGWQTSAVGDDLFLDAKARCQDLFKK